LGITLEDVKRRLLTAPRQKDVVIFRSKAQRLKDAEARQLVGQLVQWNPRNHAWGKGPFVGELQYELDRSKRPRPLVAMFPQGKGPHWDVTTAKRHLLSKDPPLLITAAVTTATTATTANFNISLWQHAVNVMVPQPCSASVLARFADAASRYTTAPGSICRPVPQAAIASLRSALVPGVFLRGLDAWSHPSTFHQHPFKGITKQLKTLALHPHADYQCSPFDIQQFTSTCGAYPADVIFSYAPPSILDVVLPVHYAFARQLVCALVPVRYCLDMPTHRHAWLSCLKSASLIRFVPLSGQKWVWLLIASDPSVWQLGVDTLTAVREHLPL
jgi:hypothetical protein